VSVCGFAAPLILARLFGVRGDANARRNITEWLVAL
jgi:hypothetical protein